MLCDLKNFYKIVTMYITRVSDIIDIYIVDKEKDTEFSDRQSTNYNLSDYSSD